LIETLLLKGSGKGGFALLFFASTVSAMALIAGF